MIDFSDEIKKYEPIHSTDLKDIMDMLNYISKNKEDAKRVSNVSPKGKWD